MRRILQISYTGDNEPASCAEIKDVLKRIDDTNFMFMSLIESKRSSRNAYGKEIGDREFDAIDPESDEAWFDDYDFVFELVVNTKLESKELLDLLCDEGISAEDVTDSVMAHMKSLYFRIKEERESNKHAMIQIICDKELRGIESEWIKNGWDVALLKDKGRHISINQNENSNIEAIVMKLKGKYSAIDIIDRKMGNYGCIHCRTVFTDNDFGFAASGLCPYCYTSLE